MQVRVFQSVDMASGLKMIKKELGPDALILSTKTIRNGKLGLLSKPMLEITAAVDNDFESAGTPAKTPGTNGVTANATLPPKPTQKAGGFRHVIDEPVDALLAKASGPNNASAKGYSPEQECFREFPSTTPSPIEAQTDKPVATVFRGSPALEDEVSELKTLVKALAGQITELNNGDATKDVSSESTLSESSSVIADRVISSRESVPEIHGDYLLSLLIDRGINIETARNISGFMRESLTEAELCDPAIVSKKISDTIQNLIEVIPPLFDGSKSQRRIALVGPTGVGKTTTLAKIAASYLKNYSHSIALITIDTYRIAAVEQLKVYGEIMHLPVDVVITPDQLSQALIKHADKELILIDTAGRSPRDSYSIDELSSFLAPEHNIEKHLVLSATTRENELVETMRQFSSLDIANTIFTKIDECLTLGVLLNTQLQNSNPISYLTNGQRVPEDLLEISPQKIAEMIMSQDQGSMHE